MFKISIDQEALYDNESTRMANGMLDYLDPIGKSLAQSQPFIKSSQRPKISCATEYTQIDEESTKVPIFFSRDLFREFSLHPLSYL